MITLKVSMTPAAELLSGYGTSSTSIIKLPLFKKATPTMAPRTKVKEFPSSRTRMKGGDISPKKRREHIIRRRLLALGKDVNWLASQMRVTPHTLYEHMAGRSHLKPRNFSKMLRLLSMDLNEYYEVGPFARQGMGSTTKPTIKIIH